MKTKLLKGIACVAAAGFSGLLPMQASVIVGSGADFSYFVLEAAEYGAPLEYEYHYTFDAASPVDTYAMMTAIDLADSNLSFDFIDYGTPGVPSYFLDSVTYNSMTLDSIGEPFWAQWVSGGMAGYPTAATVPDGAWSVGSGISNPYRQLAPGSWDGFVHNGTSDPITYELTSPPPSVDPVPEPSTVALISLGGLAALLLRRRHA